MSTGQKTIPFWQAHQSLRNYSPMTENLDVDVCIIGAGISGLTTAYFLSKTAKTIVVDDGSIAGGQTVRTTGHLSNALDDHYLDLENYFGHEGSRLAAESHRAAIDFIKSLVEQHRIPCQFESTDAYLFVPPGESHDILEKELAAAHRAGLTDVQMIAKAPFTSFETGPCLRFPNQAEFSPLPYLEKLCDLIEGQGGKIFGQTHANQIEEKDGFYHIETDKNCSTRAKHVVVATNSPINSRFFPHLKQSAYRTYVIAGKVPKGYLVKGLYYDTLDPYHYIRLTDDGSEFDLMIIGGEDHRTGEEKNPQSKYDLLEKWTRERFPKFGKIDYFWSGQVIEPVDSLAFIGRVNQGSNLYIITGDSGNGLTHGTLAGILLNDLIHGRSNPWEKLYDPHRKTFKVAYEFIEENVNTFWQYKDWMTSGDIDSIKQLKPNTGALIRNGLKKCAVFCDKEGILHEVSAVCPHLGAIVKWNSSENCWECPAHGSCFTTDGTVIQGPANSDLQPISKSQS